MFLIQNEKFLTDHINQFLLNQLNSDNITIFKNYIKTNEKYIDIKSNCEESIIGIDGLTSDEIKFLLALDNAVLKEIDEQYLKPKKPYEKSQTELASYIDIVKFNLENNNENELINKILLIKDFLYTDISLLDIENIYSLNEKFSNSLSRFEKILKELIRLIGISKTYDIYNVKTIIKG